MVSRNSVNLSSSLPPPAGVLDEVHQHRPVSWDVTELPSNGLQAGFCLSKLSTVLVVGAAASSSQ